MLCVNDVSQSKEKDRSGLAKVTATANETDTQKERDFMSKPTENNSRSADLGAELASLSASAETTVQQLCRWAIELNAPVDDLLNAYLAGGFDAGNGGANRG